MSRDPSLNENYGEPLRLGDREYLSIFHFNAEHGRSQCAHARHRKRGRSWQEISELWRARDAERAGG
jgi:hypothetical protein